MICSFQSDRYIRKYGVAMWLRYVDMCSQYGLIAGRNWMGLTTRELNTSESLFLDTRICKHKNNSLSQTAYKKNTYTHTQKSSPRTYKCNQDKIGTPYR